MTLNVNNNVTINGTLGHHTHHLCKPVINRTTGDIYASATDAAEALGVCIHAVSDTCLGKVKSCKGNKLEYLDKTSGNVDSLTAEIRKLRAEVKQLKADAEVGRAIREEKEKQTRAIEAAKFTLEKANEKLERRKSIVERKEAEYQKAIERYSAAEKEVHEAELALLAAEGKIKTEMED